MAEENEVKFEEMKKPRVTAINLGMVLGAKYFSERNAEELNFELLNVYHQIIIKLSSNYHHYCACDKYDGCRDEFSDRRYCRICRRYCPTDVTAPYVAAELFFYLEEMFEVVDNVHELFGAQHSFCFRDGIGAKVETSMEKMIKETTDLKIRNGERKYFNLFY